MFKLKTKDFVSIALLTVVYMALYVTVMMALTLFGPFGHAVSPGGQGLVAGTILYFISRKIGKMWQYTLLTAIIMSFFSIMGVGSLAWTLTSLTGALLGDLIASRAGSRAPLWKLGIASGLMHVGQSMGSIIPATFFLESFRAEWIARGQTPEMMDANIRVSTGIMAVLSTGITFALSFIGIYVGYYLLRKHFKEI